MDITEIASGGQEDAGSAGPLLHGWIIPKDGPAREVDWEGVRSWTPDQGFLWADLYRNAPQVQQWLQQDLRDRPLVCEAILEEETRPRWMRTGDGLVVILRAVNLNPGATPDDMITVRCLVEPDRVVTLRRFNIRAIQDLSQSISEGGSMHAGGALLAAIIRRVTSRMLPVVDNLDDLLAELEQEMLVRSDREHLTRLSVLRQQVIRMRRYLGPQREVLQYLGQDASPLLCDADRAEIREANDEIMRNIEELDSIRERSAITHEEVAGRMADQMNRAVYFISVIATIFLPMTVLTGLLGINVGGIPYAENPWGFYLVCGLLVVLAFGVYGVFRWRRML